MDTKTLNTLAKQFDELSELITAISGTFRSASEGDDGGAVDGAPAKPVRSAGKPAAKSASKPAKKASAEELTTEDMQEAMTALTKAKGKDALVDALAHFGASRFSEVDEDSWSEFKAKIDELMEADDDLDGAPAKPAVKKAPAKKAAAKKAITLKDDVAPVFQQLVDLDRAAAKKLLEKHGAVKLSELEDDSFEAFLADVNEAIEAADEDLTG